MEEEWRDIKGYKNKYKVSNTGKIMSTNYNNTNKPKILSPKVNKQGLLEITLSKHDIHKHFMLNRIVIQTFTNLELTKNHIVMYKDNNKQNCNLDNLYIITRGKRQEITYDTNHRFSPKYKYYNKVLSIKQISKINNINPKIIRERIRKLYWNIYEAAEIPLAKYNRKEE